jgi:zinc D-Ala-D-Ala carboxypeptidase
LPAPQSAALIAVLSVAALIVMTSAPHAFVASGNAARQVSERDPVDTLRKQATEARVELEKASKEWESRRRQLERSQEKLKVTLRDLGAADAELERIRGPLASLANATYQQKTAAGTMVVFASGSPSTALRAAADVSFIAGDQDTLIQRAADLRQRHEQLAATAQDLQSSNAVEQTRVRQAMDALRQRSAQLTKQLTSTLRQMEADRYKKLVRGCNRNLASDARRFPNGLIPSRYLCALPERGELLRADAALTFYKLNQAYRKHFGSDMCIRDSYRSLPEQQAIYNQRPGFAAVPGRSNHGLGTALDFCGGVENQGSLQFNWLRANSQRYGWFHPSWAYSNPFEPWHWEYDTG